MVSSAKRKLLIILRSLFKKNPLMELLSVVKDKSRESIIMMRKGERGPSYLRPCDALILPLDLPLMTIEKLVEEIH